MSNDNKKQLTIYLNNESYEKIMNIYKERNKDIEWFKIRATNVVKEAIEYYIKKEGK